MFLIGLLMVGAAIGLVIVARPKNQEVVPWLATESRQQALGFGVVLLLTVGAFVSLSAW
jgi:hypothetical protein